ncbi:MAG: CapA family protein [Ignavibacteriaceae bacterium]
MKVIILIISILYYFVFSFPVTLTVKENKKFVQNEDKDSSITVSITVVGDLMCHSPQFEYARVNKDSFDFTPPFSEVKKILSASDFTLGNLETVTAGKANGGYTGYPRFNTPDSYISALANTGFDLLVTANNHSLDRSENGVIKTIDQIKKNNISYVGTYLSGKDRDSIRIFDIKGLKVAVLAYSYGTNGNPIPKGKSYLINLIDFDLIGKDISNAKINGAELVLVQYHFGEEYKREPVKFQIDVVNKTIALGADVIIGGHPHVLQPVQFFKTENAKLDTGFVAYSMGNFFSNQRKRYTDAGMILTLKVHKNFINSKIKIKEANFIPTWVFKGNINDKKGYLILLSTTVLDSANFLSGSDLNKMTQAFSDTREIVREYSTDEKLKEFKKSNVY